ncbi:hypothetical protein PDESU_06484 [Pontiella desulfatans]|uniref:Phosphate-starvation-inducible E-like protein n=1 Tax=Pontiella desulfatans TaxID=2750659 RepID=A0A6C2UCG0_PONDE|nr:phosphate-starvation-inducible PsiE family protein [Pontiella desulfatans]VGO17882.1 hypothetical protein PDESU_06484 [Pontiella desulfatans]
MQKILKRFERVVVLTLLVFMMIAVFVATVEVGVILWQQLKEPPVMLLNVKEMMEVFGFILMVVIGLELLETIKAYLDKKVVHVEVVLLVAVVAVARKIIILDYYEVSPQMLYAVSALVVSLAAGFFIVRRALEPKSEKNTKE